MRVFVFLFAFLFLITQAQEVTDNKTLIDRVYQNISGYHIDDQERQLIEKSGGNPTYGEITHAGSQKLAEVMELTKKDVFYDLGSGVGANVIRIYLETPVKKAIGVELAASRHAGAQKAKEELLKQKKLNKKRKLEFREGDIALAKIDDATAVFMNSLCFSNDFMKVLTEKLSRLKPGLRVATLRQIEDQEHFKLKGIYTIPMSWSKNSTVYVYTLEKRNKAKKKHVNKPSIKE